MIKDYLSSPIMEINIETPDGKYKVNLTEELKIKEVNISKDLLSQPTHYAFITMLHKSMIKKLAQLKVEEKKAYASAYLKYKSKINPETNRPNSDDVAKQKAELDKNYLLQQKRVINVHHDVNRLETCVRAFEQKASMLQTLSANLRKEKP